MSTRSATNRADAAITDAAAGWLVRAEEGLDARGRLELDAWLDDDSRHAAAYARLERAWSALGGLQHDAAVQRHRLSAVAPAHVRRHWYAPALAALAATLLLAVLLPMLLNTSPAEAAGQPFATLRGQRMTLTLTDGSTVALDGDSRIEVRFTRARRSIELVKGQAFFQVAHDRARPFVVAVGERTVTAAGTAFNVLRQGGAVKVAVLQGRVLVGSSAAGSDADEMAPGQQLSFDPVSHRTRIAASDVAALASWREGRLRFDNAPLADVVAQFNRYNDTPLQIGDPALRDLPVSGVFLPGGSRAFATAMQSLFPVVASTEDGQIVLRRTAPAGHR